MTKNFKLVLAVILSIMMVLSSVAMAAGETTYKVTINLDSSDKAAHTYGAYQIFKGKLETKDGKDVLSDVVWGESIETTKVAALITELNAIDGVTITGNATDSDIASKVARAISDANMTADSDKAQAVADAFNKALNSTTKGTANVAAGATSGEIDGLVAGYYMIKDTVDVSNEGAQTRFILEVVKNVTVTEKATVPTVTKKVKEKNDSVAESTTDPKNPTDWQDAADYDINDVIPFKITGTLPSKFAEYDTYTTYTFTDTMSTGLTPPAASAVTVKAGTGEDLSSLFDIAVSGQTLTVTLKSGVDLKTATFGESKKFSADDTIVVEYSATLNDKAVFGSVGNPNEVDLKFSNNPNYDSSGDFGTTPKDKVIVFTYKLVTNKRDEGTTPLKGAGFTLYKWNGTEYVKVGDEVKGEDMTTFEFKGTDAGQYKLVETTVPTGYNKADDLEFKVVATYAATATKGTTPELTDLKVTDLSGTTLSTWTISSVTVGEATSQYAQGSVDITNKKGATLPSTGGIGTTIFYVAGSIMVLAAAILLITKRRMGAND